MITNTINKIYFYLLSEQKKLRIERTVYTIAILTFIIHFVLVLLINTQLLPVRYYTNAEQLPGVISTIYTPFTIILLYEIYLLIYYLPHSITIYLGKQYEIVALIIIRGIFARLANLPISSPEIMQVELKGIVISFGVLVAVLLLMLCFYKLSDDKISQVGKETYKTPQYYKYVVIKRGLSIFLLVLFLFFLLNSFSVLKDYTVVHFGDFLTIIKKMNQLFFSSFFDALIITEVLLLLCIYKVSNEFEKMIRNSGFIISTILLKISFRTEEYLFLVMVLLAVLFGVIISGVYKLYRLNNKE